MNTKLSEKTGESVLRKGNFQTFSPETLATALHTNGSESEQAPFWKSPNKLWTDNYKLEESCDS